MSDKIFKPLGASNHTDHPRAENDYYVTDPKRIDELLKVETFNGSIWECSCGNGALSKRLEQLGYEVYSSDLYNHGYGFTDVDFLQCEYSRCKNIITNPPYNQALEFVQKALEIIPKGGKVAMFLKLQFLEGQARQKLFEKHPPSNVWVCTKRITCGINGDFTAKDKYGNTIYDKQGNPKPMSGAICYAWFVWDTNDTSDITKLGWINK